MRNRILIAAATTSALLGTTIVPAKASPEIVVGVAVKAPATAATVAGGVVGGVLLHEAFTRKPFGNNGEGMKLLHSIGKKFKIKKIRW
jgi:hypothetical protein